MDCSLLGFTVHGILQAIILELVSIPFSKDFADPGIEAGSPTLQADSLPSEPPGKPSIIKPTGILIKKFAAAKSLQSCPTLCDLMDCSLPGSSVHGVFQARVLEWGAIAFSARKVIWS